MTNGIDGSGFWGFFGDYLFVKRGCFWGGGFLVVDFELDGAAFSFFGESLINKGKSLYLGFYVTKFRVAFYWLAVSIVHLWERIFVNVFLFHKIFCYPTF